MKTILDLHQRHIFLMPGQVVVTGLPILVRTILGSCIAVTMFSPSSRVGAICHAMLPDRNGRPHDLRYVDTAIHYIYRKAKEIGAADDLIIKLFGGSQVLVTDLHHLEHLSVGGKNLAQAQEILNQLGLSVVTRNVGGSSGRKLFFSILSGDVYVSRLRNIMPHPLQELT